VSFSYLRTKHNPYILCFKKEITPQIILTFPKFVSQTKTTLTILLQTSLNPQHFGSSMHLTLSLLDISCLLAPPQNFEKHNTNLQKSDFYQRPQDLGRFLTRSIDHSLGFIELVNALSNRYWNRNRRIYYSKGICSVQELTHTMITLLLNRLESTVRKKSKGLTCPRKWFSNSYNWGGFLYTVLNNLMKSYVQRNSTIYLKSSPKDTDLCSIIEDDSIEKIEVRNFKKCMPELFVDTSKILYTNKIISAQRHLIFSFFHAPNRLQSTDWDLLIEPFQNAQKESYQLMFQSDYHIIKIDEDACFTRRCSYLAWLCFGKEFPSPKEFLSANPYQFKKAKSDIHRAKNHTRVIVFRYLSIIFLFFKPPIGFEACWKKQRIRLLQPSLHNNDVNIQTLMSIPQNHISNIFAIVFEGFPSFKEWERQKPCKARVKLQHHLDIYEKISALIPHHFLDTQTKMKVI
jgi:hypothetical protein